MTSVAAERPPICSRGHVVVVGAFPPKESSGSPVVTKNLLDRFDPRSYTVVTRLTFERVPSPTGARVVHAIPPLLPRSRAKLGLSTAAVRAVSVAAAAAVRATRPAVVVGVYPDLQYLEVARFVARTAKIPLVAYLHDTVVEALSASPLASMGVEAQRAVFSEASRVFVMSEGMSELYATKYGRHDLPLEHVLPEPIVEPAPPPEEPAALFAGAVYAINSHAIGRLARACEIARLPLSLTMPLDRLPATLDASRPMLRSAWQPDREAYLRMVRQHAVLLLGLDSEGESPIHADELATIFPTKTPEFLAAGRPILVHCPEHYFLARFVRRHQCGLVVSDRDPDVLAAALRRLSTPSAENDAFVRAAQRAAALFDPDRLATRFREGVEAAARAGWGVPA